MQTMKFFVHDFARNTSKEKELKNSCIIFIRIDAEIEKKGANSFVSAVYLQRYIFTVLRLLQDFEARLRQYIIDDKGLIIIVSVNSSKTSWSSNWSIAEMAVKCSISIRNELRKKFDLETVIGITEGQCYFGFLGWLQSRVEYSIMGPTVNLSARLMSAGNPGDITCDKTVYTNTCSSKGNSFSFVKNEDLMLKGFSDPVVNYTVIASDDVTSTTNNNNTKHILEAINVLRSGLVISEKSVIKIAEFVFQPLVSNSNIDNGEVVVYLQSMMSAVDSR